MEWIDAIPQALVVWSVMGIFTAGCIYVTWLNLRDNW